MSSLLFFIFIYKLYEKINKKETMNDYIMGHDEYVDSLNEALNISKQQWSEMREKYQTAEIYFHMDLDGVTSAIAMKEYLADHGIQTVAAQVIQYGGKEFSVAKPKTDHLAVMVDFAHGKPTMHIHTDHHDSQIGVEDTTASAFKSAPSNAGVISQEISKKDLFPSEDIKLINMVDSADFASHGLNPRDIFKGFYEFDKSSGAGKNRQAMGLVVNKMLLTFKNKPNFLVRLVLEATTSLISIFTTIKNITSEDPKTYPLKDIEKNTQWNIDKQVALKVPVLTDLSKIYDFKQGNNGMVGNCLVQYGATVMRGYDRYIAFENNPQAEYMIIGWPMGLCQASKNPFKKGKNPINLGDMAQKVLKRMKNKLKAELSFADIKKTLEMDIYKWNKKEGSWEYDVKKGSSKDSFGFTAEDLMAMFAGKIKTTSYFKSPAGQALLTDIAHKHYRKLSRKQIAILENVTVSVYDLISSQSGGHRDITNVAGLNFWASVPGNNFKDIATLIKDFMVEFATELKDAKLT